MERREKQRIERAETAERRERQRNYTDKDDIDINIDIISNYQIVSFGISSFFSQSGMPFAQAFVNQAEASVDCSIYNQI